jgi:hypothetical protein
MSPHTSCTSGFNLAAFRSAAASAGISVWQGTTSSPMKVAFRQIEACVIGHSPMPVPICIQPSIKGLTHVQDSQRFLLELSRCVTSRQVIHDFVQASLAAISLVTGNPNSLIQNLTLPSDFVDRICPCPNPFHTRLALYVSPFLLPDRLFLAHIPCREGALRRKRKDLVDCR